jgi:hypothetical protein
MAAIVALPQVLEALRGLWEFREKCNAPQILETSGTKSCKLIPHRRGHAKENLQR